MFSGAAGLTYGANAIQQCAIPDLFAEDGSGPSDNWEEDLVLPGSSQMQWIKKAIMDRGNTTYFTRVPAQDIIVGDTGTNDIRVTATRDSGGNWIMVYTPTGEPFQIETKSLNSCHVQASWYDPLGGKYSELSYTQCAENVTVKTFVPPSTSGHADWVLVLDVAH